MKKSKRLEMHIDELSLKKLDYLSNITGDNGRSATIRSIIAKEFDKIARINENNIHPISFGIEELTEQYTNVINLSKKVMRILEIKAPEEIKNQYKLMLREAIEKLLHDIDQILERT